MCTGSYSRPATEIGSRWTCMPSSGCLLNQHNTWLSKLLRLRIIYTSRKQFFRSLEAVTMGGERVPSIVENSTNTEIERVAPKEQMATYQRGNTTQEYTHCQNQL